MHLNSPEEHRQFHAKHRGACYTHGKLCLRLRYLPSLFPRCKFQDLLGRLEATLTHGTPLEADLRSVLHFFGDFQEISSICFITRWARWGSFQNGFVKGKQDVSTAVVSSIRGCPVEVVSYMKKTKQLRTAKSRRAREVASGKPGGPTRKRLSKSPAM
jgi:hypothetical protein